MGFFVFVHGIFHCVCLDMSHSIQKLRQINARLCTFCVIVGFYIVQDHRMGWPGRNLKVLNLLPLSGMPPTRSGYSNSLPTWATCPSASPKLKVNYFFLISNLNLLNTSILKQIPLVLSPCAPVPLQLSHRLL